MWHPEQTWSLLHAERVASLAPPRVRVAEAPAPRREPPAGPRPVGAGATPRPTPQPRPAPDRVRTPVAARLAHVLARRRTA